MAVAISSSFGSPTAPRSHHRDHNGHSRLVHADLRLNFDGAYSVDSPAQYFRDHAHGEYRTISQLRENRSAGRRNGRGGCIEHGIKTATRRQRLICDATLYMSYRDCSHLHKSLRGFLPDPCNGSIACSSHSQHNPQ